MFFLQKHCMTILIRLAIYCFIHSTGNTVGQSSVVVDVLEATYFPCLLVVVRYPLTLVSQWTTHPNNAPVDYF